ncbi:MAG TPA: branched-chain amino acid ABC transporter permease [Dehalococcoidia bacterium]|nr:branched-chain amino acid ABC transporter permease [Dehalococcoidia bacterium]
MNRRVKNLASNVSVPSDVLRKVAIIAAALAFVCYMPFYTGKIPLYHAPWAFRNYQFSEVLLYATALLGLTVLTGRAGLVSIGHGAFVAIGAYAAGISMHEWSFEYWMAIPFGGLVGFMIGAFFGLPALRLSAHALTIVSISVALSLAPIIKWKHIHDYTGGSTGLIIKPADVPFNLPLANHQWLYFLALIIFVISLGITWCLLSGRLGRAWTASRDHEIAAESMGVNLAVYRTMAFAFAGLFAGLAGGLYAMLVQFISPESFTVSLSILLLTGLVVGGRDTIVGVIPGAIFIQFVPIWSDDISRALPLDRDLPPGIIYGVVLISVMFLMPEGVMGALKQGWSMGDRMIRSARRSGGLLTPRKEAETLVDPTE